MTLTALLRPALAALALIACAAQAHAADIVRRSITVDGTDRVYYTYVPDTAKTGKPPLLVLLHGSGSNGLNFIRLWTDIAAREGIVLLSPNALDNSGWNLRTDGPRFIHDAVTAEVATDTVDPRRIYLTGQSGGAVYALTLAMLESDFFAAVGIHAGSWRAADEFKVMAFAKRRIPMQIVIGDLDEFFPMRSIRATETALRDAGFPVQIDVMPGGHHWYSDQTAPQIDPLIWDFLKTRTLDHDPQFTLYGSH